MNAADVNNGSNTVFDIEVYKVTGIIKCAHYVCVYNIDSETITNLYIKLI